MKFLSLFNVAPNQRVNLTGKSFAPIVAKLLPSSYPYRYATRQKSTDSE